MRYFSSFTGIGGFEIGLPSEWECVGQSEVDKYCDMVLRYRFPEVKNYGDIQKIEWDRVPDFDILIGGSPCQDLSLAGKRKGLAGGRSGLFLEFVRALRAKKPEYFIWENVKGALSSNEGRDFAEVQNQFSEAGYALWWQVLNAKDFNVPHNRERIFVVGFRSRSPPEILFKRKNEGLFAEQDSIPPKIVRCLKATSYKMHGDDTYIITSAKSQMRRLTPTECERLMSWPDSWTRWGINENGEKVEISDTQRYRMCGNGVVSNVVREVVKLIEASG